MTIRVLYSCADCHLKDIGLDVPARVDDEDVRAWMDATVRLVAADHTRRRSPFCRAKALQELKIPVTGASKIGGPSIQ